MLIHNTNFIKIITIGGLKSKVLPLNGMAWIVPKHIELNGLNGTVSFIELNCWNRTVSFNELNGLNRTVSLTSSSWDRPLFGNIHNANFMS